MTNEEMQRFAVLSHLLLTLKDLLILLEGEENLKPETTYVIGRLRDIAQKMELVDATTK